MESIRNSEGEDTVQKYYWELGRRIHHDKDFMDFVNPTSLQTITGYAEPSVKELKPEDTVQFQRLGYFTVDPLTTKDKMVFNRTVGLRDSWAKLTE